MIVLPRWLFDERALLGYQGTAVTTMCGGMAKEILQRGAWRHLPRSGTVSLPGVSDHRLIRMYCIPLLPRYYRSK
jgi:hypothetical protein